MRCLCSLRLSGPHTAQVVSCGCALHRRLSDAPVARLRPVAQLVEVSEYASG